MKFSEKGAGVKGRSEIFRKFIRFWGDRLPLDGCALCMLGFHLNHMMIIIADILLPSHIPIQNANSFFLFNLIIALSMKVFLYAD